MSHPKTFLELAGAPLTPPALHEAVLLIVDAQREYVDGIMPLPGIDAPMAEIGRLLERVRACGAPVVHVAHRGRGGGVFDPASSGAEIDPRVAPRPGETVVHKGLPNAFAGTALADVLRRTGRDNVVICGFQTHNCVSATARAAMEHGFRPSIVANACLARDLPDGRGNVVPAETVHRIELVTLSDRVAIIVADPDGLG